MQLIKHIIYSFLLVCAIALLFLFGSKLINWVMFSGSIVSIIAWPALIFGVYISNIKYYFILDSMREDI